MPTFKSPSRSLCIIMPRSINWMPQCSLLSFEIDPTHTCMVYNIAVRYNNERRCLAHIWFRTVYCYAHNPHIPCISLKYDNADLRYVYVSDTLQQNKHFKYSTALKAYAAQLLMVTPTLSEALVAMPCSSFSS